MSVQQINDPAIDFSTKLHLCPSYRYNKNIPTSGSQSFTLGSSSTTNCQFELASNCYNLSKSKLVFDITVGNCQGTMYNVIHADPLALFDRIQLYTRSGIQLVDLTSSNNFSKVVSPYITKFKEQQQRSIGGMTINATNNAPVAPATQAAAQLVPVQGIQCSNATDLAVNTLNTTNQRPDGTCPNITLNEFRYLFASVVGTGVAGSETSGTFAMAYQLNLGIIYDTLLSINKDLYWDTNLILSLTFAPHAKFAGQASSKTLSGATTIACTTVGVYNMSLFLAMETNQDIIN